MHLLPLPIDTVRGPHLLPAYLQLLQLPDEKVLFLAQRVAHLGRHLVRVPTHVEPVRQAAQRLLERQRLLHLGVDVAARQPLVTQLGPAVQVHGGDDAHVGLAPLARAVRHLVLVQLERVQPELRLRHPEVLPKDLGGLVLHHEQVSVTLVFAYLLQDPEVVDQREEVAPRKVRDRLHGERVHWIAKLIDLGSHGFAGSLSGVHCIFSGRP